MKMETYFALYDDSGVTRTRLINSSGAISCDPAVALDGREAPVTGRWELNDEQWAVAEPVLRPQRRADNRGRPGTTPVLC